MKQHALSIPPNAAPTRRPTAPLSGRHHASNPNWQAWQAASETYRQSCEARALLQWPLAKRRKFLEGVELKRGMTGRLRLQENLKAHFYGDSGSIHHKAYQTLVKATARLNTAEEGADSYLPSGKDLNARSEALNASNEAFA